MTSTAHSFHGFPFLVVLYLEHTFILLLINYKLCAKSSTASHLNFNLLQALNVVWFVLRLSDVEKSGFFIPSKPLHLISRFIKTFCWMTYVCIFSQHIFVIFQVLFSSLLWLNGVFCVFYIWQIFNDIWHLHHTFHSYLTSHHLYLTSVATIDNQIWKLQALTSDRWQNSHIF